MVCKVEVTQINLQHCKSATAELSRLLKLGKTKISLIQEPWVRNNQVLGLAESSSLIFVGSTTEKPRACIAINKIYDNALLIPQCSNRDSVAISIKLKMDGAVREVIFASVYLPYEDPVPSQELMNIVEFCSQQNLPLVLGCDANAHHSIWGSSDTNGRGTDLIEFLMCTELEILNRGNRPTFDNTRRCEVIDITLSNQYMSEYIENWHVTDMILTSDHRCIYFELNLDEIEPKQFRNPRSTDWDLFTTELSNQLEQFQCNINTVESIDHCTERITKILNVSFEKACPLRKLKSKRNPPWWNPTLSSLRKNVRSKYNRMRKTNRASDFMAYSVQLKLYKHTIQQEKRKAFRSFCESIEGYPAVSRLHKALSKNMSWQLGFLEKPDGQFTTSPEETARFLLETHFPGNNSSSETLLSNETYFSDTHSLLLANKVVTEEKIRWAIDNFSPFKSSGPDKVFPAMLQKGIELLIEHLHKIFVGCIAFGYIPQIWKDSRVIFIPKPGKNTYSCAKSFRPISLQSCMLKVLERLIENYIRFADGLVVSPNQHAYLSGRSVDTALHHLITKVEKSLDQKESSLGVFLDIEGAFNNTTVDSICKAAEEHNVNPILVKWIKQLLTNRTAYTSIAGIDYKVYVSRGCPQGGVLSPLLWTIVVDSLLNVLNKSGAYVQGFADDIVILISGFDHSTIINLMNQNLRKVENWCKENSLSVNPAKTEMILFTKKRNTEQVFSNSVQLFSEYLPLVNQVKYLGVIIDSKLNWMIHIESKIKKMQVAFWQCRKAFGQIWGLSSKMIYWIYSAIVRPTLCFACHVWWQKTAQGNVIAKLDKLQRMACTSITGVMKTTPTRAVEALIGVEPLHLFINSMAQRICLRLVTQKMWAAKGKVVGHVKIKRQLEKDCPNIFMSNDFIPFSFNFEFNKLIEISYPDRICWENDSAIPVGCDVVWYSDGSLMDRKAGAGIFSPSLDKEISLPLGYFCTVFQSEVTGIIKCADECLELHIRDSHICICSDSQAALKALKNPRSDSKLIIECKSKLLTLQCRSNRITLLWVPGHSSIPGNDMADELARAGSSSAFTGPEPAIGLSFSQCISWIKDLCRTEHVILWRTLPGHRQSKSFIRISSKSERNFLLSLPRQQIKLLTEVLTGHARLRKHLCTIGALTEPTCPLCEEEDEDSLHFLCQCPALHRIRKQLFGHDIISSTDIKTAPLPKIIKFINKSNRFNSDSFYQTDATSLGNRLGQIGG